MSVVTPALGDAVIVDIVVVSNFSTLILNVPFSFDISVDKPDNTMKSFVSKLWLPSVKKFNLLFPQVIVVFSFFSVVVSILSITFPSIFDITDIKPLPDVPPHRNLIFHQPYN